MPTDSDRGSGLLALKSGRIEDLSENLKLFVRNLIADVQENGFPLKVVHNDSDYSIKAAADILRFSQSYFCRLLDSGAMPFHMVGSSRRVYAADLLVYKEKLEKERKEVFREISQIGQKLEM